jgi:hypothetical protein
MYGRPHASHPLGEKWSCRSAALAIAFVGLPAAELTSPRPREQPPSRRDCLRRRAATRFAACTWPELVQSSSRRPTVRPVLGGFRSACVSSHAGPIAKRERDGRSPREDRSRLVDLHFRNANSEAEAEAEADACYRRCPVGKHRAGRVWSDSDVRIAHFGGSIPVVPDLASLARISSSSRSGNRRSTIGPEATRSGPSRRSPTGRGGLARIQDWGGGILTDSLWLAFGAAQEDDEGVPDTFRRELPRLVELYSNSRAGPFAVDHRLVSRGHQCCASRRSRRSPRMSATTRLRSGSCSSACTR